MAGRGCAIVISGHEMRAILPYADTITWVTAGTTYDLGKSSDAFRNENFRREYLGATANEEMPADSGVKELEP